MDATFDYQVWNQPILAYNYTYFNPANNVATDSLATATIAKNNFTNDRFAAYRGNQTDSIVGIAMDVDYIVETRPSHQFPDGPHRDGVTRVSYRYDLELDFLDWSNGQPIPSIWQQIAAITSEYSKAPMAAITERLIQLAN